ncbi:MAG: hypoxanthine-guanine phosphoribosyltransferase [Gammaproteobacteria bacterium]|nr:hypoxanthine-guanine phosphoribosyltransferase [Gammaproteobacteria bacterium]
MLLNELQDQLKDADLLYSHAQIKEALMTQANEINQYLNNLSDTAEPAILMPVMNGGLIYAGQLLPMINQPVQIDYIHATRYRNTTTGYELNWKVHPQSPLNNRVVIILDDIFDEGLTLEAIAAYCKQEGASQVLTSVLVTKIHDRRTVAIRPDFSALDVPDRYVFGFGMDYKGQLRNADGIYAIKFFT